LFSVGSSDCNDKRRCARQKFSLSDWKTTTTPTIGVCVRKGSDIWQPGHFYAEFFGLACDCFAF
jgi:hypothetical protein